LAEASDVIRPNAAFPRCLLVPTSWTHPSKEFLRGWYERIGYRVVRTGHLAELYPDLAPLLATECDLLVFHEPLDTVDG
jgi:hypothetical protein